MAGMDDGFGSPMLRHGEPYPNAVRGARSEAAKTLVP